MPPQCANDRAWNELELRLWRAIDIEEKLKNIMASQKEITDQLTALTTQANDIATKVTALVTAGNNASADLVTAATGLAAGIKKISDALPTNGATLPTS